MLVTLASPVINVDHVIIACLNINQGSERVSALMVISMGAKVNSALIGSPARIKVWWCSSL